MTPRFADGDEDSRPLSEYGPRTTYERVASARSTDQAAAMADTTAPDVSATCGESDAEHAAAVLAEATTPLPRPPTSPRSTRTVPAARRVELAAAANQAWWWPDELQRPESRTGVWEERVSAQYLRSYCKPVRLAVGSIALVAAALASKIATSLTRGAHQDARGQMGRSDAT